MPYYAATIAHGSGAHTELVHAAADWLQSHQYINSDLGQLSPNTHHTAGTMENWGSYQADVTVQNQDGYFPGNWDASTFTKHVHSGAKLENESSRTVTDQGPTTDGLYYCRMLKRGNEGWFRQGQVELSPEWEIGFVYADDADRWHWATAQLHFRMLTSEAATGRDSCVVDPVAMRFYPSQGYSQYNAYDEYEMTHIHVSGAFQNREEANRAILQELPKDCRDH